MNRSKTANRALTTRSAVTNGTRVLVGVNGCSAQARRYRDIIEDLEAELGPNLSAAERLQVRNVATLQFHAEELTGRLVRGEAVDPEAITRASNGANRALAGLRKRKAAPKDPATALRDILANKAGGLVAAGPRA